MLIRTRQRIFAILPRRNERKNYVHIDSSVTETDHTTKTVPFGSASVYQGMPGLLFIASGRIGGWHCMCGHLGLRSTTAGQPSPCSACTKSLAKAAGSSSGISIVSLDPHPDRVDGKTQDGQRTFTQLAMSCAAERKPGWHCQCAAYGSPHI